MIKFITTDWSWDITNYGLTFNETSPYFLEEQEKNYSFPISVVITPDIAEKLNLVYINNHYDYPEKIYGQLFIDDNFEDAYLAINEVAGFNAEITFFYGKETLSVFDKKLRNLPFGLTKTTNGSLQNYAKDLLSLSWPETSHQFIKIYNTEIGSLSNYSDFQGFINNTFFTVGGGGWVYLGNLVESDASGEYTRNRNVMSPNTYLLEVLKVGFKTAGYQLRGQLVESPFFKAMLLVPKNFMEYFAATDFLNYSFKDYTEQEDVNGQTINVYRQIHTPGNAGTYTITIRINMNSTMAKYFNLKVTRGNTTLYQVTSENKPVSIEHTITLNNVDPDNLVNTVVEMRLLEQGADIEPFNSFEYSRKEGQLNRFPGVYTIADFMPDITFREFLNRIVLWLNLKVEYTENAVYLDFLEAAFPDFIYKDRSSLEQPEPTRTIYKNNLFRLSYPDSDTPVYIDKDGENFNTTSYEDEETTKIDFNILPLKVEDNDGSITALYPEDEEDIMVILYDGTTDGENLAKDNIDGQFLTERDIYNRFWKLWLNFRANSKTERDSFLMHYTEALKVTEGEFKYNNRRLIVSLRKKRVSAQYYNVEIIAEAF